MTRASQQDMQPSIPDYLIYDEIRRRRKRERWQREQLEMPLYRPEVPAAPTSPRQDDTSSEPEESDRGVTIIDMNDWFDEQEEDAEECGG